MTAVPARHTAGPLNLVLPAVNGSVLEYQAGAGTTPLRIYVSGDTVYHQDLAHIRERFPVLDLALLHLGGTRVLGVLLSMDHKQGVDMVELLRPARVVPIHHDEHVMVVHPAATIAHMLTTHYTHVIQTEYPATVPDHVSESADTP